MSRQVARECTERGFTLTELIIVVAVIAVLAGVAIPLYANMQARARVAKAQDDVRTLVSAIIAYSGHCGDLPGGPGTDCPTTLDGPTGLAALTRAQINTAGLSAGPFLNAVPTPPAGWGGKYTYTKGSGGAFTVSASGDGTTVSLP